MPLDEPMPLGVTAVMLAELDFDQQVSLCGQLGVSHYVFRPRYIPEQSRGRAYHNHGNHKFDLTPERLIEEGPRFKAALEAAGITPFCTLPKSTAGDDDATLRRDMQGAAVSGCSRIRITPPAYPKDHPFDYDDYLDRARQRFAQVIELAGEFGLKIAIEMHGGNSAASPALGRNLVEGFDPNQIGLIVDLPNFAKEGFILPNLAVSVMGRSIDHIHLGGNRRVAGDYDAQGFRNTANQMCPLTESDLSIPDWLQAIAAVKPDAVLVIEDFTANMSSEMRLRNNVDAVRRLMG